MGNYGVSKKLNLIFNVNHVHTAASAGTLRGMKGLQDASLTAKFRLVDKRTSDYRFFVFAIGTGSVPMQNYVADYVPLSIGMKSKTATGRALADFHWKQQWFGTASASYTWRSNITLDRDSYFTDKMILSNQVEMPNLANYNFRAGYRGHGWIVEGILNRMVTLGGFDITRNNMPFPSNRMNATSVGSHLKYEFGKRKEFSVDAEAAQVIAGRNVGKSLMAGGAFFYIIQFGKGQKTLSITQ